MNKTRRLLTLVLVLAAGLFGGAITERMNYAVPTEAQRTDRPPGRPDRWEYCALSKAAVGASRGGLLTLVGEGLQASGAHSLA